MVLAGVCVVREAGSSPPSFATHPVLTTVVVLLFDNKSIDDKGRPPTNNFSHRFKYKPHTQPPVTMGPPPASGDIKVGESIDREGLGGGGEAARAAAAAAAAI